ncbi:hypothetical protein ACFL04_04100, partial [Patescibacteria group bacterium]
HLDCGAYGGSQAFASADDERQQHFDDLNKAKNLVSKTVPELTVVTMLANIDGHTVSFEKVK